MPNKLINETSPYLLQHAHNPVDWYPWGEEALNCAKEENKPILVSIGYAACHWCHVMEKESFENEETAALMNRNFINIKIDREERPDLDHIYMDAVQAMTGSGGWPLNVFLTPDAKPFYGGTYFPPKRAFNRPSWPEILEGVADAFNKRRHEIDAQAENLTEHLLQSNSFGFQQLAEEEIFPPEKIAETFTNLMKNADKVWGGFGKAPKFPQTFSIQFLLRFSHLETDSPPSEGLGEALTQALLSLNKMIDGGIYDQFGGGFARYSTDNEWLAPHFEKMLYDNALLVSVLSEAFQLTKQERYKEVIDETMVFLQRELMSPQGGFYSALDADSEGIEGKYYVWEVDEINEILGKDATLFCEYYDITKEGNWTEAHTGMRTNIPRVKKYSKEVKHSLENHRKKILEARNKRVRPLLDDKIILGWNGLMNTACSKAFAATGNEKYKELAVRNMKFLLENFISKDGKEFYHVWKEKAKYPAFLDDLGFLVEALYFLQEITPDAGWLKKAKEISEIIIRDFSEEETGFFFYTMARQKDVIVRKKEVYDGAVPSGNSVMALMLWRLGILFDEQEWKSRSRSMVSSLGNAIVKYPGSFGNWACLHQEMVNGTYEIAITGTDCSKVHLQVLAEYIPQKVLVVASKSIDELPLVKGKDFTKPATVYLCSNYTCKEPVFSAAGLISLINKGKKE